MFQSNWCTQMYETLRFSDEVDEAVMIQIELLIQKVLTLFVLFKYRSEMMFLGSFFCIVSHLLVPLTLDIWVVSLNFWVVSLNIWVVSLKASCKTTSGSYLCGDFLFTLLRLGSSETPFGRQSFCRFALRHQPLTPVDHSSLLRQERRDVAWQMEAGTSVTKTKMNAPKSVTLPETNSSPLKMDGWNTTFLPLFSGATLVSGRV